MLIFLDKNKGIVSESSILKKNQNQNINSCGLILIGDFIGHKYIVLGRRKNLGKYCTLGHTGIDEHRISIRDIKHIIKRDLGISDTQISTIYGKIITREIIDDRKLILGKDILNTVHRTWISDIGSDLTDILISFVPTTEIDMLQLFEVEKFIDYLDKGTRIIMSDNRNFEYEGKPIINYTIRSLCMAKDLIKYGQL